MKIEKIYVDFGHIVPVSTVDWHKKAVCMIFFNKCPFRCPYCQNHVLLNNTNVIDVNIVKKKIEDSFDFVNTIVFSGGEPTTQENALDALLRFSKRNDLETGVQTNGYFPSVIRKIVDHNLVDKVFMDMKAPPSDAIKYEAMTGVKDANKNVAESFNIVNMSRVPLEIRTTVFRPFIDDVFEIAEFLESRDYRDVYTLQTGIPENSPQGNLRNEKRIPIQELRKIANKIYRDTGISTYCI